MVSHVKGCELLHGLWPVYVMVPAGARRGAAQRRRTWEPRAPAAAVVLAYCPWPSLSSMRGKVLVAYILQDGDGELAPLLQEANPDLRGTAAWVAQDTAAPLAQAVFRSASVGRLGDSLLSTRRPALGRRPTGGWRVGMVGHRWRYGLWVCGCVGTQHCAGVLAAWGSPHSHLPMHSPRRHRYLACAAGCMQVAALAGEVEAAPAAGYIVRVRADAETVEARANYTGRRDALFDARLQVCACVLCACGWGVGVGVGGGHGAMHRGKERASGCRPRFPLVSIALCWSHCLPPPPHTHCLPARSLYTCCRCCCRSWPQTRRRRHRRRVAAATASRTSPPTTRCRCRGGRRRAALPMAPAEEVAAAMLEAASVTMAPALILTLSFFFHRPLART